MRGARNVGGGIHWFRAAGGAAGDMTQLVHTGFLPTLNTTDGKIECPDVFQLGEKVIVLGSTGGLQGFTFFLVGTISADDLAFTAEYSGRLDYGANGISSMYCGKTATEASPPYTRRVVFSFSGWSSSQVGQSLSACSPRPVVAKR